jgi:hypothetical protein
LLEVKGVEEVRGRRIQREERGRRIQREERTRRIQRLDRYEKKDTTLRQV